MKNRLIKTLSLCMACLTLTLLLNVAAQGHNSKPLISTQLNEDAPWIKK